MELLRELIYMFNESGAHALDAMLPEPAERELFNAILKGRATTDEEAAQMVSAAGPGRSYQVLKGDLVKSLAEMVFGNGGQSGDKKLAGQHELLIAEKLLHQTTYHDTEKIILSVKAYAEKCQVLPLQIDCAQQLRAFYAAKGQPKEVEFYNIVLKKLSKFFQYEQEAIGFIGLLESRLKHMIGRYREIALEAKQYSMQLREWQKESNSPALKLYQYRLDLVRCYHVNDVREWRFILERITDLANAFPFLKTAALHFFIDMEWARYMRCTASLTIAADYLGKALPQSSYELFTRFEVQALAFDLAIKQKNYDGAGALLAEVKNCRQFPLLEPSGQAAWLLREAYLYFIFLSLNDPEGIAKYTSSFTNEFPVSALVEACKPLREDKKGYNLMLVIIKALLKLKQQSRSENEATALLAYYTQNMKDACDEPSKNFLKKLARAAKSGIPKAIDKKENKTADKVAVESFDAAELVPYDTLFELLASKGL